MPISRVTAQWSGFPGAPGYSNFHFQSSTTTPDVTEARGLVHEFFETLKSRLPSSVRITVSPTIEILDDATGSLVSYADDPTELGDIIGTSTGSYAGPTGAVINWLTNTVVAGRRLRGRTFIVPLSTVSYEGDGTLTPATLTALNAAATVLSGAGFESGFGILSRPAGGGSISFGEVVTHRVPDLAAVLRSRRD